MRIGRAVAAAMAVLCLTGGDRAGAQDEPTVCDRFGTVEVVGSVEQPLLRELSGLAASRHHSDVVWAHNDSGGKAELYALTEAGQALGSYPVADAPATDWEDLAVGPDPEGAGDLLYVADIGDNDARRESVWLHLVPEPGETPVAPGRPLEPLATVEVRYATGPTDAETVLVDPRTADLVVVTKDLLGRSRIMTAPAGALTDGAQVTLLGKGIVRVPLVLPAAGELPATMVTGGTVSPDGSIVLLRTYGSVLAFERRDDQTLADALRGEPCEAPSPDEPQGEAITFTADGSAYLTAGEGDGVPVHRVDVAPKAAPASSTSTTAGSTSTASPSATAADAGADAEDMTAVDRLMWAGLITAFVLMGAVAVVLAWRLGRRSGGR